MLEGKYRNHFRGQMRDKCEQNIAKKQKAKRLQNSVFNSFTAFYERLFIFIYRLLLALLSDTKLSKNILQQIIRGYRTRNLA